MKRSKYSEIATSNFFTLILPFLLASFLCILAGFFLVNRFFSQYARNKNEIMLGVVGISTILIVVSFVALYALNRFYLNTLFEALKPAFFEVKAMLDDVEELLQRFAKNNTKVSLFTDELFLSSKYQLIAIEAALKEQLKLIVEIGNVHSFSNLKEARMLLTGELLIRDPINRLDLSKATQLDLIDAHTKIALLKKQMLDRYEKCK